jgi:hypothetical protein
VGTENRLGNFEGISYAIVNTTNACSSLKSECKLFPSNSFEIYSSMPTSGPNIRWEMVGGVRNRRKRPRGLLLVNHGREDIDGENAYEGENHHYQNYPTDLEGGASWEGWGGTGGMEHHLGLWTCGSTVI